MTDPGRVGLRANLAQFSLLVGVNALVGGMVGIERSILPLLAERDFHIAARAAALSFLIAFGLSKAAANYLGGRLSDRLGRKRVLVAGWLAALPVPLMLIWAPSWSWVLFAKVWLGASQGLAWSMTVVMKIDLDGPERRGLAMGLNEFAGYGAVALLAWTTAQVASSHGLRPYPFLIGVAIAFGGLAMSMFFIRETLPLARQEDTGQAAAPTAKQVFLRTSYEDPSLSAATQAGFVNNLNDAMAWGLFPLLFAAAGTDLKRIGWLAAAYPAAWAVGQIGTGALSDAIGRKPLIAGGMRLQAAGIALVGWSDGTTGFACGQLLLGVGTALAYPPLLAAVGDGAEASWRAGAVGVYRLWRDLGYAAGAVVSGLAADALGIRPAIWIVGALTFASGAIVAARMSNVRRLGASAAAPAR
ncbi:MAG: MFS transporter [Gemmatimonadetes bacterium 13_1_40CM_66_11]|nr:MAG: MFS transporter [Gemmatimonadetes bacterium 13_1_40CM_66_11]